METPMQTPSTVVISDTQVLHRAEKTGDAVTRVQVIECEGRKFENSFWSNLNTGRLIRMTSREL